MSSVRANGVSIEYESLGSPKAPAILLVMGLAMQLVAWPDSLCAGLVERGFRVIRFDNRDSGLSSKMRTNSLVPITARLAAAWFGLPVRAPYGLEDMAGDAIGLMDALDIRKAHVVGASMGGMIAQLMALDHPRRVASLTSIMSNTGERSLPGPKPSVAAAMMRRRSRRNREEIVRGGVDLLRLIGSPAYPQSDEELRRLIERSLERSYYPQGFYRQLLAIQTAPSRADRLRKLKVPTLVIHGQADPLIPVEAGKRTAALIPNARLRLIEGFGHDLPEALAPKLADLIAAHCAAAQLAHAA